MNHCVNTKSVHFAAIISQKSSDIITSSGEVALPPEASAGALALAGALVAASSSEVLSACMRRTVACCHRQRTTSPTWTTRGTANTARQVSPSASSEPYMIAPTAAPRRPAEAILLSCVGHASLGKAAWITCVAAPQVAVYASELSTHIRPKTVTDLVAIKPAVEATKRANTRIRMVEPPTRSVTVPSASLPIRHVMDVIGSMVGSAPASASEPSAALPKELSSLMVESSEGIITRDTWFIITATKSSAARSVRGATRSALDRLFMLAVCPKPIA
mmetsp:Transcript_16049/g.38152  ORF Transcript_16049/g.38152 Transcript_16049/m.38152 type:complete len:275 (-) Transcript_16049:7-831(-)